MPYQSQLELLQSTLHRCNLPSAVLSLGDSFSTLLEKDFLPSPTERAKSITVGELLGNEDLHSVYRTVDRYKRSYLFLPLSRTPKRHLLFIGPFLSSPLSSRELLELSEELGVTPKNQRYLDEYYQSLPILHGSCQLYSLLESFWESIHKGIPFSVTDLEKEPADAVTPLGEPSHSDSFDDLLVHMRALERRYAFENDIMRMISQGQLQKESTLQSVFTDSVFEKRSPDPLRNAKNYGIIMNTLFRKAAENGGVHPIYLDRISSDFAKKIEALPTLSGNTELMREMFRSYCRLVRKHATKQYSPVVQQTVLMIDSDLSSDLSLSSLAAAQNISSGYLSTIFKKETGETVSAYVRKKRIRHAVHLLTTTHLQIQTVALHCGILDVQYFSKLFKKETGKTPKEYREQLQSHGNPAT